jgi:alginate O-acetyltransferase complex protein AlgI
MSVSSVEFVALILLLTAVFFNVPGRLPRQSILAAVNLGVFCWAGAGAGAAALAWNVGVLALFLLSGYAVATLLRARPRALVLAVYIAALTALFVYLKKYTALDVLLPHAWLDHPVAIVGLSYMLFRQIHFVVDVAQGEVEAPRLWTYLNYQTNFATLLAGPIQRYQDYARDWDRSAPLALTSIERLGQYQRIFIGVIKVVVFATLCTTVYEASYAALLRAIAPEHAGEASRLYLLRQFVAMFYAYPAFVFFNFSGYCDIVIGAAALLGMKLPENFDRPYVSRNMIDFWTRQHMSLSFWIRDYLFTPMYKAIVERQPEHALAAAYLCYFVAFLLAGIWHGSTMNFVVFGLLHGAGVSAVKVWEAIIIKRAGRKGLKEYLQIGWVRAVAIFVTLNFVSFAFMFFTPDLERKLGVLGGVVRGLVVGGGTRV